MQAHHARRNRALRNAFTFGLALICGGAVIAASLFVGTAEARPEKIQAGMSYYSDDYVVSGEEPARIHDIEDEKNYEEVYQFYTYYEAIYDATERVTQFIEYRRGEVKRREKYEYGEGGGLVKRTVERPGKEAEVTVIEAK